MTVRCEQCIGEVCDEIFKIHSAANSFVTEAAADAELSGQDMTGVDEYLIEHRGQVVTQVKELLGMVGCGLELEQIDARLAQTAIELGVKE